MNPPPKPPICPTGESLNEEDNLCYKNYCFESCSEPNFKRNFKKSKAPNCEINCTECNDGYAPSKDGTPSGCYPNCGANGPNGTFGCEEGKTCIIYNSNNYPNYKCVNEDVTTCSNSEYNGKKLICNGNFSCPESENELCILNPNISTCEDDTRQICTNNDNCENECELYTQGTKNYGYGLCKGSSIKDPRYPCCNEKDKIAQYGDSDDYVCCGTGIYSDKEFPIPTDNQGDLGPCCKTKTTSKGYCCEGGNIKKTDNGYCCSKDEVVSGSEGTFCCNNESILGSEDQGKKVVINGKNECILVSKYPGILDKDNTTGCPTEKCKFSTTNPLIGSYCDNNSCKITCGKYDLIKTGPDSKLTLVNDYTLGDYDNVSYCRNDQSCTVNPGSINKDPPWGEDKARNSVPILKYNDSEYWKPTQELRDPKKYLSTTHLNLSSKTGKKCGINDCLNYASYTPTMRGAGVHVPNNITPTEVGCDITYTGNDFGDTFIQGNRVQNSEKAPTWNKSTYSYDNTSIDCRVNNCSFLKSGIYCSEGSEIRSLDGTTCTDISQFKPEKLENLCKNNNFSTKNFIKCQMPKGDSQVQYEKSNCVYYIGNDIPTGTGWNTHKSKLIRNGQNIDFVTGTLYNDDDRLIKLKPIDNYLNPYTSKNKFWQSIYMPHISNPDFSDKTRYSYSIYCKITDSNGHISFLNFDETKLQQFNKVNQNQPTNLVLNIQNGDIVLEGKIGGKYSFKINTSYKTKSGNYFEKDILLNLNSYFHDKDKKLSIFDPATNTPDKTNIKISIIPIYNSDNHKWTFIAFGIDTGKATPLPYGAYIFYLSSDCSFKPYTLCTYNRGNGHDGAMSCNCCIPKTNNVKDNNYICNYNWGYDCQGINSASTDTAWPGLENIDFPIDTNKVKDILFFEMDIFSTPINNSNQKDDNFMLHNQNNTTNSFTNSSGGYNDHFNVPYNVYDALTRNYDSN